MLDFLCLAKYPVHTDETLDLLDDALGRFHNNKDIFIDLGVRANFNIPKLHFSGHYRYFIELFGTTDNYNTEYTERLHIDLAKDAYRSTNFKDEYPQMTAWLERREKILRHDKFIRRQFSTHGGIHPPPLKPPPCLVQPRELLMAKHPSAHSISLHSLKDDYGATFFQAALARFVAQYQNPNFTKAQVEAASLNIHIPFQKLSVYHRIKFVSRDPYSLDHIQTVVDSIHAQPARLDKYGKIIPGRFDTGLINYKNGGVRGVKGQCSVYTCNIMILNRTISLHRSLRWTDTLCLHSSSTRSQTVVLGTSSSACTSEIPCVCRVVHTISSFGRPQSPSIQDFKTPCPWRATSQHCTSPTDTSKRSLISEVWSDCTGRMEVE
jgi:hypothetical protein